MLIMSLVFCHVPACMDVCIKHSILTIFPYFSCERNGGRLSRVILSYTPVMVVLVANPIVFIIAYYKGKLP